MLQKFIAALVVLFAVAIPARAEGQQMQQSDAATALAEALGAACRQNEEQFARYLTVDNAAAFQGLAADARLALMKRLVLLDNAGRPLLSNDPQQHTIIRCETPGVTAEMRFGEARVRENLAFIPVEITAGRRIQFGMVREGNSWKLLSVGLLLLDLPALAGQWTQQAENSGAEAGEAAAIAALRKIADAIATYQKAFGKLPETLAQLGPAPKQGVSPEAGGLLDAELAAGKKGGYVFRYVMLAAPPAGGEARYELAAQPVEYGKTGRRSFFLDASGILRGGDKQGAVATVTDPRIEPR